MIGEDAAERLDVIPAQFRAIVTHRPKYACRVWEEAVVQAGAPERLIKGGLPTEAMVASVLVAKYAWHLPLYRQPFAEHQLTRVSPQQSRAQRSVPLRLR
jgi:transposase